MSDVPSSASARLRRMGGCVFGALFLAACGPAQPTEGPDASGNHNLQDARPQPDIFISDPNVDDDGDGYTENQGDCNDASPLIHPFAVEICDDGVDNNCNGALDSYEPDQDGDGFGPCQGDCNDDASNINPATPEVPDGQDNNCDGIVDGDYDGDGYTTGTGDCDDTDPAINPDAVEYCYDGVDNDCNGYTDAAEPDQDNDGFGPCQGDCDDTNPNVGPHMGEVAGDGVDNNCDNLVDQDIDGDGWTVANGDCDDNDPDRHPAVPEICGDGIDNDCDTVVDTDCLTPCEMAELENSYIGCDYWATSTMNSMLGAQFNNNFALVVHNANADPANVTVSKNGAQVAQATIQPGQVHNFLLTFDNTLRTTNSSPITVAGGAFHLVSDQPVTVYQFNPFDFQIGGNNSYTNDASLVLPKHVLTGNYLISTRATFWDSSPGFLAVIGTGANTQVQITYAGHVWGGPNAGQSATYTLNEGDVLQVPSRNCSSGSFAFCSDDYDFTGSRIEVLSGDPVAVFAGHDCVYIPPTHGYCDHLEEQMVPLETWGSSFVATTTAYTDENQYRVLSGAAGNTVTFTPAVHGQVTLNEGDYVTFQTTQNFQIDCSGPCLVTQFLLSGDYLNVLDSDPAMGLLVPFEQFRESYSFLVPSSMTRNYVSIIKPVGAGAPTVFMDGAPLAEALFSAAIGNTSYGVARIDISSAPYSHELTSSEPFGIMVYGYAEDTSYLYPGGMNLEHIFTVE